MRKPCARNMTLILEEGRRVVEIAAVIRGNKLVSTAWAAHGIHTGEFLGFYPSGRGMQIGAALRLALWAEGKDGIEVFEGHVVRNDC